MHRVVVDTAVLLLGFARKGGAAAALQRAWVARRYHLITSNAQLETLERASRHARLHPHLEPLALRHWLGDARRRAEVLVVLPSLPASEPTGVDDPVQEALLATAFWGSATWIVTPDADALAAFRGWYGMRVTEADALVRALGEAGA